MHLCIYAVGLGWKGVKRIEGVPGMRIAMPFKTQGFEEHYSDPATCLFTIVGLGGMKQLGKQSSN